jgi:ribosomal protein S9
VAKVNQSSRGKARRKTSYAEATITKGQGNVTINGENIQDYFGDTFHRV